MSKLGLKYQIVFTNCELDSSNNYQPIPQTVTIDIYDRTNIIDDAAEVTVISLTAAGDPLHIVSIDNSEDKFTPIRAQQAIIKFESDENFDLSIFTDTIYFTTPVGDPRYYVEIYIRSMFIFKGFLTFDDCSEAFMPTPNIVTLTATDGLGWLKDIPLTLMVTNPSGFYRIADYLAGALALTGLSLPLNVISNIREYNNPDNHMFDKVWLWDKSFEADLGVFEDGYSVLSKILGEENCLFQFDGQWWIVRFDEFESTITYRSIFNSDGSFNSTKAGTSLFQQFINKDTGTIFFSQEATEVLPQSEHKWVKEIYRFDSPKEIPCNIDFSRQGIGTEFYTGNIFDDDDDPALLKTEKRYNIDCWTAGRYALNGAAPLAPTVTPYLRRIFKIPDYEEKRYVVMPGDTEFISNQIKSEAIFVDAQDKFQINCHFRSELNYTDQIILPIKVELVGDDGKFYYLNNIHTLSLTETPAEVAWWYTHPSAAKAQLAYKYQPEDDRRKWVTLSIDASAAPISGSVFIYLSSNVVSITGDLFFTLDVEYIPYLNGTYRKFTFISDKVYQPVGYRAKREKDVYVSDGIKKLFKGGFHRYNGTSYILANQFFNWAAVQSTTPPYDKIHSYLHLQTYDVWNQYRNVMRIFHITAQGLQSNITSSLDINFIPYPSPVFHLILQDSSRHTNNKIFGLLTWDLDFYTCEWKGTAAELFDSSRGKRYDDPEEVKYGS